MKLPSGLKTPGVKAPDFVTDVYYDLRDRRLLPLIALVAVAIVATPLLLGDKSETTQPPQAAGAIEVLKEASEEHSTLTVVEARPGLRDYRKRLRGRTPTDPFVQRYTQSVLKGAELNEQQSKSSTDGEGGESTSTTDGGSIGGKSGGGSGGGAPADGGETGGGGSGGGKQTGPILYTFAVNLTIVHSSGSEAEGDKKKGEPDERKRVLPTTVLPGKKTQVVTYLGLSPKTRKPLFLVSDKVTGVFGDGKCISGTDSCQLIELEPGFPELFEYGDGGDRYSIKVTKVELVLKGRV
ncbi:MAG TPA: hypothetical protein VH703_03335 [Solirubrobacterales bacterium]|jgi:hypothetical protein